MYNLKLFFKDQIFLDLAIDFFEIMQQNLPEKMKFHNGTYRTIIGFISIAVFDLLIGRIWLTASCLAGWTLLLMRNPNRVRSRCGIVSPVMGIMKRILNMKKNKKNNHKKKKHEE